MLHPAIKMVSAPVVAAALVTTVIAVGLELALGNDPFARMVQTSQPQKKAKDEAQAPADDTAEQQIKDDEKLLQDAKLATNGKALVEQLRSWIPVAGDENKVAKLFQKLDSGNFKEREQAAKALVEYGPRAIPILQRLMPGAPLEVRLRAENCLKAVEARSPAALAAAAVRLLKVRAPAEAVTVLLEYAPYAPEADELLDTVYTLAISKGKVHPAIVSALKDELPTRRAIAAALLGRFGNAEQKTQVAALLHDKDPEVRFRAAHGLVASGNRSALPALVQTLAEGSQPLAEFAEEILIQVAGKNASKDTLDSDEAARKKCHEAWREWLTANQEKVDFGKVNMSFPLPSAFRARKPACIILWMSGGPSQIDTFDPKLGDIMLFEPIDTAVKGLQFSQNLPKLAKQAKHLAVIRSLTHRAFAHGPATFLMRTGYAPDNVNNYPSLGAVLAKELKPRADRPRHISIGAMSATTPESYGPGFLGAQYGPLMVTLADSCPDVADFEALAKGKGEMHRKAVQKAFDLGAEKKEVRDAYGNNGFGQRCLLARRLIEHGVPVVEVTMTGWDAHANARAALVKLTGELDSAMAMLLKELSARKRLQQTLIVWMGEFGRTPQINRAGGRDHWPQGFSVVLAGGGIKGGQAIGKTSANAMQIEERPVTPAELFATIYRALGVDPTRQNQSNTGRPVRLVEAGAHPVKEALR
jgi:HEAT repeat protein